MKLLFNYLTTLGIAISFSLLSPSVNAQSTDQNTNRSTMFRTLGWGVNKSDLYYLSSGDYLPLTLAKSSLSGYHAYSGSSNLQVFRKLTDESTGAESYIPFLEASLVSGASEQILVFFQSPSDRDLIRVFAYEDSLEQMKEQAVFIGNFSPLELAFQVSGEERFGLKPGQSRIIDYSGDPQAKVAIAAFREDEWRVEYRATHRLRRGYRYYFFFRDMDGKSELMRGVSPIVHKETLARVRNALESPDGELETGRIEGSTVPFDPEAGL